MTEILLSTFNGAKYLREFLDSLVAQTDKQWSLHVRDDGSTDDSVAILQSHSKQFGYKLHWHPTTGQRLGYPSTYFALMKSANGDTVFLADQDDVWLPQKIARMRLAIEALPTDCPAMVHTDLIVVDSENRDLAPSFLDLRLGKPPRSSTPLGLLLTNYVTGTASVCNRALCQAMRPPGYSVPHDWWTALTASLLGTVQFLDMPAVCYRQHSTNAIGAFSKDPPARYNRNWLQLSVVEKCHRNRQFARLAEEALRIYRNDLSPFRIAELESFRRLDSGSPLDLLKLVASKALPTKRKTAWSLLQYFATIQLKDRLIKILHPIDGRQVH